MARINDGQITNTNSNSSSLAAASSWTLRRVLRIKRFPWIVFLLALAYFAIYMWNFTHGKHHESILEPLLANLPSLDMKALLAKQLQQAGSSQEGQQQDPKPPQVQDPRWYSLFEEQEDYHNCKMNRPYPRPPHACVTDEETRIPYCSAEHLRVNPSKILSPIVGGESDIEEIKERAEEIEYLKYDMGAFMVATPIDMPKNSKDKMDLSENFFYLHEVLMATKATGSDSYRKDCAEHITEPTLFITRYEYADLPYVIKDWWNAFFSLPEGATSTRVVFLDAHAKGGFDEAWETLFGQTMHVKEFSQATCFDQAIFVPPGYSSVLWPRHRIYHDYYRCEAMTEAFVRFVLNKHGLEEGTVPREDGRITIVERTNDFFRHPRSIVEEDGGGPGFVRNWDEVQVRLGNLTNVTDVEVVNLEKLSFVSQLRVIRKTHLLLGLDSMLAHAMFLPNGTQVVDLSSDMGIKDMVVWKRKIDYTDLFNVVDRDRIAMTEYENILEPAIKHFFTPGWDDGLNDFDVGERDDLEYDSGAFWDVHNENQQNVDRAEDYHNCLYYPKDEQLPDHGCLVPPYTSDTIIPFCRMSNVLVDTAKIRCSHGGETIDSVFGRDENEEFPVYEPGAFVAPQSFQVPSTFDEEKVQHIADIKRNLKQEDQSSLCNKTESTLTFFVTRYDYVDLSSVLADWWNAFLAMSLHNHDDDDEETQMVFLDGHAKGHLDDAYEKLFGPVQYIQEVAPNTCFETVLLLPSSHACMLRLPTTSTACPSMMKAFVDHTVKKFDVADVTMEYGKIVMLDVISFRSHPRKNDWDNASGGNFDDLAQVLRNATNATSVEILRLDGSIPFAEQIRHLRTAHILMGTSQFPQNLVFMQDGAHLIEFNSWSSSTRDSQVLGSWKTNMTHHIVTVDDSPIPSRTIEREIVPLVRFFLQPNEFPLPKNTDSDFADEYSEEEMFGGGETYEDGNKINEENAAIDATEAEAEENEQF